MKANRTIVTALLMVLSTALHAQAAGGLIVRVGGLALPPGRILSIGVDEDAATPPAARIAVQPGTLPLDVGLGLDIAAIDGAPLFQGEIFAVRPTTERSGRTIVEIEAKSLLHRLTREAHTRTFDDLSDAEIVRLVASEAGLIAEITGTQPNTKFAHVFQHNQTNLEFLLERAARIGYELFADDTAVHFRKRAKPLPVLVGCDAGDLSLQALQVRIASTRSVREVAVRGLDVANGEEIHARARQAVIALSRGASQIDPPPLTFDLGFVQALQTGSSAYEAAAGTLLALTAGDLAAEMRVIGSPGLRAGTSVAVHGAGDRFDGEYFVQGVSHRYKGSSGGYHTLLKTVRADRAAFLLPEIGDEVLVAFESGDINRPIVVGSLWTEADPPDSSPCRRP